jgi:hypothetical protein
MLMMLLLMMMNQKEAPTPRSHNNINTYLSLNMLIFKLQSDDQHEEPPKEDGESTGK